MIQELLNAVANNFESPLLIIVNLYSNSDFILDR
jgi:hypothetical protein